MIELIFNEKEIYNNYFEKILNKKGKKILNKKKVCV